MRRRDFITTSVGAGLLIAAYPRSLFARFQAQERRGTMFDKIWDAHLVDEREDGTCLLYVDRHLIHEVTSPQAFAMIREEELSVPFPELVLLSSRHNQSRPV